MVINRVSLLLIVVKMSNYINNQINFNNFIQVAGVIDQNEANLILDCGVRFLGFPLRLPINKVDLNEDKATEIIKKITPPNFAIIISYSSTAKEAVELCSKLGSNIIQLHGDISLDELQKLKFLQPDIFIIKSLVIKKNNLAQLENSLIKTQTFVDAFITDTFDPLTGASGATGKTHDWEISKKFVELSGKPVILAGGLNYQNVFDAIIAVKPSGVDVHTGVENSYGRKDKVLLNKFVEEANKAFNFINGEK